MTDVGSDVSYKDNHTNETIMKKKKIQRMLFKDCNRT